jgi:hypothetical protein
VATYAVGRRLWPERPRAALMAAGLLFTSSQFLVTAMTPYSMTAHLALNMVWLWLFLRGGRLGHAGALIVGFLATGLHQIIFHPLFAAPFVLDLWIRRRWRLAALYTAGYAAICVFWLLYWSLALRSVGAAPHLAGEAGAPRIIQQVLHLLGAFNLGGLGLMAKNLARFMTWQNPLTVPLVILGAVPALRASGAMRSLLLGLLLTTAAMLIILPAQGAGWGYRYLHGFLGSAALLATQTWMTTTDSLREENRAVARVMVCIMFVAAALLVPVRAWQAHQVVHPYVLATRHIQQLRADVVLVAEDQVLLPRRLVRNDPDLVRRPLTMPLPVLDGARLRQLCTDHSVALFQTSEAARFGIRTGSEGSLMRRTREDEARVHLKSLGCSTEPR